MLSKILLKEKKKSPSRKARRILPASCACMIVNFFERKMVEKISCEKKAINNATGIVIQKINFADSRR